MKTKHPLHALILQRFALHPGLDIKTMFGGECFMLNGNMCCAVVDDKLMARVGPLQYEHFLSLDGVTKMDFTGKPLTGFVYIEADFLLEDEAFCDYCLSACEQFCLSLPLKPSKPKSKAKRRAKQKPKT